MSSPLLTTLCAVLAVTAESCGAAPKILEWAGQPGGTSRIGRVQGSTRHSSYPSPWMGFVQYFPLYLDQKVFLVRATPTLFSILDAAEGVMQR